MVLLCRTTPRDQCARASDGMSVLLIDMREAVGRGLTIRPIRTMLNHATTELFFDDLRVPASSLIGDEGKGFRYILSGMNAERILIAAECIGDGHFFIDRASAYAKDRKVFGRAIGANQGVQFPIARAHVAVTAASLMVARAAETVRCRRTGRQRCQYGQNAGLRGQLAGRRHVYPDLWRVRLCRGVRHRAQVPRKPGCTRSRRSAPI